MPKEVDDGGSWEILQEERVLDGAGGVGGVKKKGGVYEGKKTDVFHNDGPFHDYDSDLAAGVMDFAIANDAVRRPEERFESGRSDQDTALWRACQNKPTDGSVDWERIRRESQCWE